MSWKPAFALGGTLLACAGLVLAAEEEPAAKRRPAQRGQPAQILSEYDQNGDKLLERAELPQRMLDRFPQMDANGDGRVSLDELRRMANLSRNTPPAAGGPGPDRDPLLRYLDSSGDGELSADEIAAVTERLGKLDKNEDGKLDHAELAVLSRLAGGGRNGGKPGEIITPAAKGERISDKLKVGDVAPDFLLPRISGKGAISLTALRDKKPVVLIFASNT